MVLFIVELSVTFSVEKKRDTQYNTQFNKFGHSTFKVRAGNTQHKHFYIGTYVNVLLVELLR